MTMTIEEQVQRLKRGCLTLVDEKDLAQKLSLGRPLRVKLGVDPTSADLHLGHSVVLTKLRAFQELGHTAVLIIGDFTAAIGDPSGRDSTRPQLGEPEIEANAQTYLTQAQKILDPNKTELRRNSEWLKPFVQNQLLSTLKNHTIQQILAREDFKVRLKENSPLTVLECLYPIFQGQDSVAVKADIELGGGDQITNLLVGRKMQQDAKQPPQVVMTLPLLVGTDGVKKMSKSYGNAISFNDSARDIFGKVMKISDDLMLSYYELLTDEDLSAVKAKHPMDAKKDLAQKLTERYHGVEAAAQARRFFEETFSEKKLPENIETVALPAGTDLIEMILRCQGAKSKNEARRLVSQGGVRIDGLKMELPGPVHAPESFVLQMGKHRFVRVRLSNGN
jgi:tyrosyl-tRNA synthetase